MTNLRLHFSLWLVLFIYLSTACSKKTEPAAQSQHSATTPTLLTSANEELRRSFSEHAQRTEQYGQFLGTAINELLQAPNPDTLAGAQTAWLSCVEQSYGLELLFQLANSAPSTFPIINDLHYSIAATPIQPGYLDRFGDYAFSGLVYDIGFELNAQTLREQNGLTDSEEVTLGLYAIQFMLFGENGERSALDYVAVTELTEEILQQQFSNLNEVPANRRRELLALQNQLLQLDLSTLVSRLAPESESWTKWQSLPAQRQTNSVRDAVSTSLTQVRLNIGKLQSKLNKPTTDLPSIALNAKRQSTLQREHNKLLSLHSALPFYSEHERDAVQNGLIQAETLLKEEFQTEKNDNTHEALQHVYQQLKPLI